MTDSGLEELDERAATARRSIERIADDLPAPTWRLRQTRSRLLLAAAAVVAIVVVGAALAIITRGDDDGEVDLAAGGQAYYVPTETLGLPLLRAVRGDEIPAPGTGYVALYGADTAFRGPALAVMSQQMLPALDLQAGDGEELVDVDGTTGLLRQEPGTGFAVLSWQPKEGVLLTLLGKGLDRAQVLAAAADVVVGDDRTPTLGHPAALGLEEVAHGRSSDILSTAVGGVPGRRGTMLAYGSEDGTGPHVTVVTGPGDQLSVDAIRLTNPGAEDIKVGEADAVAGPISSTGETFGWVIGWSASDGTTISVMGLDASLEEVLRVARSVRPISADAFQSLADSDGFDPADELPGLEADQVTVIVGELADGTRWRLQARDPLAGGPVNVAFTWMHDQSSTSAGITASSPAAPLLLASRANTEPEHIYGFAASSVEVLWWEAPDGGGGQISLIDIGDPRGSYFEVPLPSDSGVVTLFASNHAGTLSERTQVDREATVEIGETTATTAPAAVD